MRWLQHLPDPIRGCWYLDDHWNPEIGSRTQIGELVYRAKTYEGKPGEWGAAKELSQLMQAGAALARRRRQLPLDEIAVVVPVPAYPPREPYNLPDILGRSIAGSIGASCDTNLVTKFRETPPAKTRPPDEVAEQLAGALRVTRSLSGESVLLVDDLVHRGTTLSVLGRLLVEAGARTVGAFVATRARRGLGV